jgi:IclR family transcriptional regulator, pca regulon regulatory protein
MPRGKAKDPGKPEHQREAAWSDPDLREPRYSQSLERGLAILGCFSSTRPVLGIADIADALGMSRSTTHRYVITLVALGYLEQGASRKYRLGLRVTDLGMSALHSTGLREHSHPELEELRRRTSYTAGLGVLDGEEILYVDRARGFRLEQTEAALDPQPGSRLPVHCTAIGKLLLAYLPEHEQRELIAQITLTKHGPNTITSKQALRDELEQIRRDGLAVNDQELAPQLRTLAAPVRDQTGTVLAAVNLSIPGASTPLAELVDTLGPQLLATAERISAGLGYRGDDE